jgi:hypothetical protein
MRKFICEKVSRVVENDKVERSYIRSCIFERVKSRSRDLAMTLQVCLQQGCEEDARLRPRTSRDFRA